MLKLKVCGMVYSENIKQISVLRPDYMGFIFYEKSKRYAGDRLNQEQIKDLPESIKKIGVFVNSGLEEINDKIAIYGLDLIQLHGDETVEFCSEVANTGTKVIKAFSLDDNFDFSIIEPYKKFCTYFLFDTKGKDYGGNGISFNWEILNKYDNEKPFFLSGGLDLENIENISKYKHLNIHAIDVNSKFEISPGLKDIAKVTKLIEFLNY
jgi:phosphoribosylanthranilate isomerase